LEKWRKKGRKRKGKKKGDTSFFSEPCEKELPENLRKALEMAGSRVGDFLAFWGFKKAYGILWLHLFLSPHPLTHKELTKRTGLSKTLVSLSLKEMIAWGAVIGEGEGKNRVYYAETHIGKMIQNVLQKREIRYLLSAQESFQDLYEAWLSHPTAPLLGKRILYLKELTERAVQAVKTYLATSRIQIFSLRRFFSAPSP